MKNKGIVLLVFAKTPVAGEVKTRLIPELGQEKATALYKEMLTRTINTSIDCRVNEIQLWISGDAQHEFFNSFKHFNKIKFYSQTGSDLGQRMFNAFELALQQYSYAILIGSDCPELLSVDIDAASKMLEYDKDIVLGPAFDGGYYLIALKNNNTKIFSSIEWGGDSVFRETCSRAKSDSMEIGVLATKNDIDHVSDLHAFNKETNNKLVY